MDVPARREASADALLAPLPEPLDDLLPVLLGDHLPDLADQDILPAVEEERFRRRRGPSKGGGGRHEA